MKVPVTTTSTSLQALLWEEWKVLLNKWGDFKWEITLQNLWTVDVYVENVFPAVSTSGYKFLWGNYMTLNLANIDKFNMLAAWAGADVRFLIS
jgi:hypothetical protein